MEDEVLEGKLFATFEKHGEFSDTQRSCLELDLFEHISEEDDRKEYLLFQKLYNILDVYQEQSYLLDPYLENMVAPVVDCLRSHAKASIIDRRRGSPKRVERLALLLYSYVKCRGYKTINCGSVNCIELLTCADGLIQDVSQWALRYVVLIWLSLICMIPFDLAQFDETDEAGNTATSIESAAKGFLGKAGLERQGAALLLSRLYTRYALALSSFLEWSRTQLEDKSDVFTSVGLLQVLCEVVNSGPADQIQDRASQLLAIATTIEGSKTLASNTTVRKFKTKLLSRVALRLLPAGSNLGRRKGRILTGDETRVDLSVPESSDMEVPEEVESVLEQLFDALQDKDTVVRWSAAKGVARISERLPVDFADQVFETILGLFAIHSITAASLYDLPAIAESTWHGACLACAETARRGLIASKRLPELIEWLSKALYFDLRKGAHSIGSNVRDAAAYVLWALARTQDPSALAPHAQNLAQRLTAIHIRRAASCGLSRTCRKKHVLGQTDFYAVSIRRNAYLTAAPQVTNLHQGHPEYRPFLLNHVLDVVLRHWDATMRELGSQSLRLICQIDLATLGPEACAKSTRLLDSIDVSDLHGGLLALSEIALAYRGFGDAASREGHMRQIFQSLSHIPFDVVVGSRNAIVTAAACRLISITVTLPEIQQESTSVPQWRKIVDHGLKHRTLFVQEAAADAMASISKLQNLTAEVVNSLYDSMLSGLDDYSTDERGDVGSWIRVACIQSLTAFSEILIRKASLIPDFNAYLPPSKLHSAVSGILKQGVERLDNVRQVAGECVVRLLDLPLPAVHNPIQWKLPGMPLLEELFRSEENVGWNEAGWLFPRAVRLLEVAEYRSSVLYRAHSTHRPLATSLVTYVKSLPSTSEDATYDMNTLVEDLIAQAKSHITSNTIVIPVLQTFNVLLDGDALIQLSQDSHGLKKLDLLYMITRNVSRLKSIPRIQESMKMVVNLLPFEPLFNTCVPKLVDFLGHQFPSIRSHSAEYLYVSLQGTDVGKETDEIEEVLLETEWSSPDEKVATEAAERVVALFLSA
ncbi:armadillo-type protein [Lyophyllum atratum]|nr:armadillo-type protein [Lyophyllum atratum]